MSAKKWIIATGVVVVVVAAFAAFSLYYNEKINDSLAAALVSVGAGATGKSVSISGSRLNLFTGEGEVENITVPYSSKDGAEKMVELGGLYFEISPLSLFSGPVRIKTLTAKKVLLDVSVRSNGTNLATLVAAASAYAAKNNTDFSKVRLIFEHIELSQGVMKASFSVPGRTFQKKIKFPEIKMAAIGANENGISPASFAKKVIQIIANSAAKVAMQTKS